MLGFGFSESIAGWFSGTRSGPVRSPARHLLAAAVGLFGRWRRRPVLIAAINGLGLAADPVCHA